jgi:hypothetical protein
LHRNHRFYSPYPLDLIELKMNGLVIFVDPGASQLQLFAIIVHISHFSFGWKLDSVDADTGNRTVPNPQNLGSGRMFQFPDMLFDEFKSDWRMELMSIPCSGHRVAFGRIEHQHIHDAETV